MAECPRNAEKPGVTTAEEPVALGEGDARVTDGLSEAANTSRRLRRLAFCEMAEAVAIERHGLNEREDRLVRCELQLLKGAQGDARPDDDRLPVAADIEPQIDQRAARRGDIDHPPGKGVADREMRRALGCENDIARANTHADRRAERQVDLGDAQPPARKRQFAETEARI